MLNIKIVGCHSRDNLISQIISRLHLSNDDIIYDDRPNGGNALYTVLKALKSFNVENCDHIVILADDAYPCDNFLSLLQNVIDKYPNDIISLFPLDDFEFFENKKLQIRKYVTEKSYISPYWIGTFIHGVGYVIPSQYLVSLIDFLTYEYTETAIDDNEITKFAKLNNIRIINTLPSLVQHIGDDSLLNKESPIRRTKYFSNHTSANWDSDILNKLSMREVCKVKL